MVYSSLLDAKFFVQYNFTKHSVLQSICICMYTYTLFSRERYLLRAFCLLDIVLTAENLAVKNQAETTKFIVVKQDIAG